MNKIISLVFIIGISFGLNAQDYPQMVFVQGGNVDINNTSQKVESFKIAKTEITNSQWSAFKKLSNYYDDKGDEPRVNVSICEAEDYCKWLSFKTGKYYRLPTEAEWKYAAKGGNKSKGFKYSGSNSIEDVCWYYENSKKQKGNGFYQTYVHKVATKIPNELGLYDMNGNVSEWCYFYWEYNNYKYSHGGVHRGGNFDSSEEKCTISYRDNGQYSCTTSDISIGFRIVEVISKKELDFHNNEIKKSLE